MAQPLKAWTVFGEIGLDGLGRVTQQLNTFHSLGVSAAGVFGGISSGALLAAGGFGIMATGIATWSVSGIRNFALFDDKMTQSLAILDDVSDAMKNDMAIAARDVGTSTRFGAAQAAEAFYFLASAGLDAQQTLEALPIVADFATAGNFDLEQATSLLADAQNSLGMKVADATQNMQNMVRVADAITAANILANASSQEFALALSNKSAARMRQFGVEVEEGVAILAAFAAQGAKGQLAGERLSILLRDLTRQAVVNAKAFKENNIQVFDEGTGALRKISDITRDFENRLRGLSAQQQAEVFAQLHLNEQLADGVSALIGMSDEVDRYEQQIRDMQGITEEVADKQLSSLSAQFDLLRNKVIDADYSLGRMVRGSISHFLETAHYFVDDANRVSRTIENWSADLQAADGDIRQVTDSMTRLQRQGVALDNAIFRGLKDFADYTMKSFIPFGHLPELQERRERERREREGPSEEELLKKEQALVKAWTDEAAAIGETSNRLSARGAQEAILHAESMAWLQERTAYEIRAGLHGKEARLQQLQEELNALDIYSQEWKDKQFDIMQLQKQINDERAREAERRTEEQKRYERDLMQFRIRTGELSTSARIQQINAELTVVKANSKEELDLLRERHDLREQLLKLEDQWLQYRIQIGEIAKDERIRQINEELTVLSAIGQLGSQEELSLLQERMNLAQQIARERISLAQETAKEEREAALASLESLKTSLREIGSLSPALSAEIDRAMTQIQNDVVEKTNELQEELARIGENMGRDLIRGLITGSRSLKDVLRNALSSVLSTVLWRVGSKALGIASPSKKTMYWGEMLMAGTAVGFESMLGDTVSRMVSTNERLLSAVSPRLSNVLGSFASGSAVNALSGLGAMPAPVGAGLHAGVALNVPLESLPPAKLPMEVARDAAWMELLSESLLSWEEGGGRLRRS